MTDAFILGAKRTPIGSFQGTLAEYTAPQLGAHAIRAAIDHAAIDPHSIDEAFMGCVVSAGVRQAPARQAMRGAGVPDAVGTTTVNKVCGSGMKAAMLAADLLRAGSAHCVLAGGMESMTNAPYLVQRARAGLRMGHAALADAMFTDGLEDAETGNSMGIFAQDAADQRQLTRQAMDDFAIRSVAKAQAAMDSGALGAEIRPLGEIAEDEQPRRAKIDRIPHLRPAFKKDGTITAANASSISDGASALVIGDEKTAQNTSPLARIVGHATHSIHPADFAIAPAGAIEKLLAQIGWHREEVDIFEINEAFACVPMMAIDELGLDREKVNVYGGACAQGHPLGSTGSRLIVTLAHALNASGGKRGIASLCIGGGEATAVALERA